MCVLMTAYAIPAVANAQSTAEWTILVYLDGDNNLDPDSVGDIEEMEMVGSTDKVNVLVLWDRYYEPAYLYKVVEGDLELVDGLEVNGMPVNGEEISMADWRVLEAFVDFGKELMPAEHYMLDLWDHGSAYGYTCWDDHAEAPWNESTARAISLSEVVNSLEGFGNMDILAYDGCTIGMVEIAYELNLIQSERDVSIQYLVASEEYIPNSGFPYNHVLEEMNDMDLSDVGAVAMMLADVYAACYSPHGQAKGSPTVNLSVVDLAEIGPIGAAIKDLVDMLIEGLSEDFDYYRDMIAEARGEANLGWSLNGWDQRIDVTTLLMTISALAEDEELSALADDAVDVILDAVYVANTPALEDQSAYGLGVWFPVSFKSLGNANAGYRTLTLYTDAFAFADDAGWMEFLYAFWGKAPKAK